MPGFCHECSRGQSVEWYTPPEVFEALAISFDLDPAAPAGGVPWVPAERFLSQSENGLVQPWAGRVWLNPPYGRGTAEWLERLARHGDGLALVFARTDTRWYQEIVGELQRSASSLVACLLSVLTGRVPRVPEHRRC
jgi:hypothetical protein